MRRGAIVISMVFGLAGCSGGAPALPPPSPAPVAACLTLVVPEEKPLANAYDRDVQNAVRASFQEAMIGAGLNVLADPALPHDLVARVAVQPGSRVQEGAQVRAVLTLESHGSVIDTIEAAAVQGSPGYGGAVADQLVDGLFRSGGLAAFTRALRSPKSKQHLAASALRAAQCGPQPAPEPPPIVEAATPLPPPPPPPGAVTGFLAGPAQPAAYALVVGIDTYKNAPSVASARADAGRFAEMAHRTLGVADNHMKVVLGDKADRLAFEITAEWLKLNVPQGGRVYFYFSGLGALRRKNFGEYLVPYDGDPKALDKTAVSLVAFLQLLGQTRAKDVIAIVDAGFSGAGVRSVASGEAPKPPGNIADPEIAPRVALLSAVTSADTAGDAPGGAGGLFTRYLTEGIGNARADIDGDGRVSLQELMAWAGPRVAREARRDKRTQTPAALLAPGMGNTAQIILATGLPVQ